MNGKRSTFAAALVAGLMVSSGASYAASLGKTSGALAGSVRDVGGTPQMGAAVLLYNRYDKLILKTLTDAKGDFGFDNLLPDIYSVRVTLSSFVPALKRNIQVEAGVRSVLAISLAGFLSSIELIYNAPSTGTLMSDDWKWVLRSSMTTRPVLRAMEVGKTEQRHETSAFTDTRGVVRVSAGDESLQSYGMQPDLGTSFALATSLYGSNQFEFSGNIGYLNGTSTPSAGFRTSYSRGESAPEVKLTMQQVMLPSRSGLLMGSGTSNAPMLRTMSVTTVEHTQLTDNLRMDYGATLESVQFLDRLNFMSPFARLSYDFEGLGVLDLGYSSGAPPVELLNDFPDMDAGLQSELAALSLIPRVSLRDGRAHVQRTQNVELGYTLVVGSRTYSVGAYREGIRNAALTVSAPAGFYDSADLLPDLGSNSYVFNIGRFKRYGYSASVTQLLGDDYNITLAYGSGGVLGTDGQVLQTNNPNELRNSLNRTSRHWLRGRIAGIAPVTGTKFAASYEWTDYRSLMPGHVYLTQKIFPETGLNIRLRQPIPSMQVFPGRLEASAELRNLLAQGYLNMLARNGNRLVMTHSPRALRGGLSFIF